MVETPVEAAVLQELIRVQRVPALVIDWLVAGHWAPPTLVCDVAFPRADYSGLLEF
ncbi:MULTISPECIES: hypothetical protein [unclassified Mycobacterium]|uniref:hypothetical protein n=1 Tax=unclassified Mycobacterium TaxID=2642494 RepID=UPI0012E905B4|nr:MULTISPECIES: hypothetical protein [unclassified Mycobacterium]